MSLLIGVVLADRVVLMADSFANSTGLRNTVGPKIDAVGPWALAHAGAVRDWALYRSLIDASSPLDDPTFIIDVMAKVREIAKRRGEGKDDADLALLLARGSALIYADESGQCYPCAKFSSAGLSWSAAEYHFAIAENRPFTLPECLEWGLKTLREIGRVDRTIEVPPMYWMNTVDLLLGEYP